MSISTYVHRFLQRPVTAATYVNVVVCTYAKLLVANKSECVAIHISISFSTTRTAVHMLFKKYFESVTVATKNPAGLFMCTYVCTHVYLGICIRTCMYICIHTYVRICKCFCLSGCEPAIYSIVMVLSFGLPCLLTVKKCYCPTSTPSTYIHM